MFSVAQSNAAAVVASATRTAPTSKTTRVAASNASIRGRATSGRRGDALTAAAFTPAGAKIAGVGMAVPEQYLTNDDLGELVETNDEWIKTRTGIGKRHVISGDESLTSLAADASRKALEMAGVKAEDLDLILLATSSPDDLFGSACTVRRGERRPRLKFWSAASEERDLRPRFSQPSTPRPIPGFFFFGFRFFGIFFFFSFHSRVRQQCCPATRGE